MPDNTNKLLIEQFGSWTALLSISFTIFVVFVSITSWIHSIFEPRLLLYFENSLADFREFTHLIFDMAFFKWISVFIAYIYYLVMLLLEPLFNWVPYIPNITVPSWVRDSSIISIILLRSQKRAMLDSDPLTTLAMTEPERKEWESAISGTSQLTRATISCAWKIVLILYFITKIFRYPFDRFRLESSSNLVGIFVGGCLQLGIAYFLHDVMLGYATKKVNSRYASAHRSFMKITALILGVAFLASMCFFFVNGYMVSS